MRTRPALFLAALAALAPACGHRGDPLPPLRRTPPPLQDFRLAQRGDALELQVTAPGASVDGVAYESPTVEFLHVVGDRDIEKTGSRRAVRAAPGSRVTVTLPLPGPGTTVRASARGVAGGERGPRALTRTLVTQAPLESPRELAVTLTEGGAALSWRGERPKEVAPPLPKPDPWAAPAGTSPPVAVPPQTLPVAERTGKEPVAEVGGVVPGPRHSGFLVYRRVGGGTYGSPIVGEPLEGRAFDDTTAPPGATACYVVRAVASIEPLVESAPSNEACLDVRDITAPATPSGLVVLPREGGLEVLWSPSAEPDLAGYRVYRAAPGGPPERVSAAAANRASWLDEAAARGVVYRYSVSALDQAGNESLPTEPVEGSLP